MLPRDLLDGRYSIADIEEMWAFFVLKSELEEKARIDAMGTAGMTPM